jgi:hypothetical protein
MPSGLPARSVSGKGWSRRLGIVLRSALTAKANGLTPFDYLKILMEELPKNPADIDRLLPWNVEQCHHCSSDADLRLFWDALCLPRLVFGPVDLSQGLAAMICSRCRCLASSVQSRIKSPSCSYISI